MKCPKCGKKLLEGQLYCEHCGEEINLVPEFEAKVEQSLAESIQGIAEELIQEDKKEKKLANKKKNTILVIVGIIAALLVFALSTVSVGSITVWNQTTFFQEKLVEKYLEEGKFDDAVTCMESVIAKEPKNTKFLFQLSEIYAKMGRQDKSFDIYQEIAKGSNYTLEERLMATEHIIDSYVASGNYKEIASYLESVKDENIKLAFMEYMLSSVTFSQPEGNYTNMITVKLSCDGIGKIHYTTDGTVPDENSPVYQNTIFLDTGNNVISAVFINEHGMKGPVITKKYRIEGKKVTTPEVLTYSGKYTCPIKLEIEKSVDSKIYYTTDGTNPTKNSNVFTGSFYLPLGKSVYKFIAIGSNGEVSEVVTRNFEIVLDTEMTINDAKKILVDDFVQKGAVLNEHGQVIQDENHIFVYEYLYPMTVKVGIDCYYFAEVSRDSVTLEQSRTGTYYGVDIRTGDIHTFYK